MKARGGFSLVQVALAMVILGLVGIAMAPRFSSAASDARIAGLCESLQNVRRHIEVYRRQHNGQAPVSADETGAEFVRRLTRTDGGNGSTGEDLNPRLERMPINPYNRLDTVRIGGAAAGAGTHGWRFDPATGEFQADDNCDADADGRPDHASL